MIAFSRPPESADTVAPGTLSGIVIDDTTGRGVAGATVYARVGTPVRDVSDGAAPRPHEAKFRAMRSVRTDAQGRFHMAPDSVRAREVASITVQVIGYGTRSFDYHPQLGVGYVIRIALHPTPLRICADFFAPYPEVHVFDALTGRAPPGGATLVVAQGNHSASAHGLPSARDTTLTLSTPADPPPKWWDFGAPVDLTVESVGYWSWREQNLTSSMSSCGGLVPISRAAWLLPRDSAFR